MKLFEVEIDDNGNVVVTVNAHSGKATPVAVRKDHAEVLAQILERIHTDYAVRGWHR